MLVDELGSLYETINRLSDENVSLLNEVDYLDDKIKELEEERDELLRIVSENGLINNRRWRLR